MSAEGIVGAEFWTCQCVVESLGFGFPPARFHLSTVDRFRV